MTREIKFRAWDNVDERMIFIGEDADVSFSFDSCGITATKLQDYNDYDDSNFCALEHLKYMQYTNLKDSKGVEIYEGDILKCHHQTSGFVFYLDGSYHVSSDQVELDYENHTTYDHLNSDLIMDNNLEVVGNIYESEEKS